MRGKFELLIQINTFIEKGEIPNLDDIFHCHIHLIPRRKNDVTSPRGGVRGVIPDKQSY